MQPFLHLKIAIKDDLSIEILPLREPFYMPYLSEMIKYLALLSYSTGDREYTDKNITLIDKFYPVTIDSRITRHLFLSDDELYIKPFYHSDYCTNRGGFYKSHFVRLQMIVYELLELWSLGLCNFKIVSEDGTRWEPNIHMPRIKPRSTKEKISGVKAAARIYTAGKTDKCPNRKNHTDDGYIFPCCMCRVYPIKLCKKLV
jgi:hypothetical protein